MAKLIIIEGNSNDKDNVRAYMVKGEPGDNGEDGISPSASVNKTGDTAIITITDREGTTTANIKDGANGADLTDGAVPTGAVIGFDGATIPGGFEEVASPIKTITVTGTTNAYGTVSLGLNASNAIVLAMSGSGGYGIPILVNNDWYAYMTSTSSAGASININKNTNVNVTVYYIEI